MELRGSLERPCRPAFVSNYCLIKHAGQLPGSNWVATGTQLYTECLQPPRQANAFLSGPLQKQLQLKRCAAASVCFNATSPSSACDSVKLCCECQVLALSPRKDNTIILKPLSSLIIEFLKVREVLRDGGGELLVGWVESKRRERGRRYSSVKG